MNQQDELEILARDFDLKPADIQFLELIPLIEVMWADGRNQEPELKLLYKFTIEHIAHLDRQAGLPSVSVDHANDFLERFAHRRPPRELLERLRELAFARNRNRSDQTVARQNTQAILDYCLDIAAACIPHYPYQMHERIMQEEKHFLKGLVSHLAPRTDGPETGSGGR